MPWSQVFSTLSDAVVIENVMIIKSLFILKPTNEFAVTYNLRNIQKDFFDTIYYIK